MRISITKCTSNDTYLVILYLYRKSFYIKRGVNVKKLTWSEYYDRFYDWAESTQVCNLSALTSLGTADEVGEIIIELQVNVPAANRLLKKAVEAKLEFSASDLLEFFCINDKALATAALYNSVNRLSAEDMEELYGFAEDDDIIQICKEKNLILPEDLREEYEEDDDVQEDEFEEEELEEEPEEYIIPEEPEPKVGFFSKLIMAAGIASAVDNTDNKPKGHCGKCNGDCANCPPHYGYRYGRWYYGHGHQYSCEFGGNKGDGSMD